MGAYAWKTGAWKTGALKTGSWGTEGGGSPSGLEIVQFTGSPLTVYAGQTVYFDYYVSGSAVRREFDFDMDGTPDVTPPGSITDASGSVSNIFTSAGTYSMTFLIHNTDTTTVYTRLNYITVLPSALESLGGGRGGITFDMHGGLAGIKTSRTANAYGIKKRR